EGLAIDGESRMAALPEALHQLAHGRLILDRHDVDTRHHDIVDAEVRELDDVEHHRLRFLAEALAGILRRVNLDGALEAFAQAFVAAAAQPFQKLPPETVFRGAAIGGAAIRFTVAHRDRKYPVLSGSQSRGSPSG